MFPRAGGLRPSLFWPFQVTPASLAAPAPLPVFCQPFLLRGPFNHQSTGPPQEGHGRVVSEPLPLEALPLSTPGSQLRQLSEPQRHGLALTVLYTSLDGCGGTRDKSPARIQSSCDEVIVETTSFSRLSLCQALGYSPPHEPSLKVTAPLLVRVAEGSSMRSAQRPCLWSQITTSSSPSSTTSSTM